MRGDEREKTTRGDHKGEGWLGRVLALRSARCVHDVLGIVVKSGGRLRSRTRLIGWLI